MPSQPRLARRLQKTLEKAERIKDKLKVDVNVDEIKAIAVEAAHEAEEVMADASPADKLGEVIHTVFKALDIDESDLLKIADMLNDAIDIPYVPEGMEQFAFRFAARQVWNALQ